MDSTSSEDGKSSSDGAESPLNPPDDVEESKEEISSERPQEVFEIEVVTTTPNVLEEEIQSMHSTEDRYFARGEIQDFQCVCRACSGYSAKERRANVDRVVPCFSNGPLCLPARSCWLFGQKFRTCSRVGNFTILLERIVPRSRQDTVCHENAHTSSFFLRHEIKNLMRILFIVYISDLLF